MLKNEILNWFRKTGLMPLFDRLYFFLNKIYFIKKNRRFRKDNPLVKIPPDYMIYENFRMDYANYYNDGRETAAWLIQQWSCYLSLDNLKIFDWGCGPARVVRHLPEFLPQSKIYASDYNEQTIEWCKQNIPGIEFIKNSLEPPLPFHDQSFDIIYALSVFTHLSQGNHHKWIEEMYRLLKPGGIFLLTTQGNIFVDKLMRTEKKKFSQGALVVRGKVKEGHRSFSAFHPKEFMQSIFTNNWQVLKFTEGVMQNWGPEQDTWIIQKI
jgi:ubiquinone/menaquinone biosynthesis C-methylase UbiE